MVPGLAGLPCRGVSGMSGRVEAWWMLARLCRRSGFRLPLLEGSWGSVCEGRERGTLRVSLFIERVLKLQIYCYLNIKGADVIISHPFCPSAYRIGAWSHVIFFIDGVQLIDFLAFLDFWWFGRQNV